VNFALPPELGDIRGGAGNYTGYCSVKASKLMAAANAELNPEKRAALFRATDKILASAVPQFPLYQRPPVLEHRRLALEELTRLDAAPALGTGPLGGLAPFTR
jgi:ABC-type transport system substrate-binding protein